MKYNYHLARLLIIQCSKFDGISKKSDHVTFSVNIGEDNDHKTTEKKETIA